MWRAACRGVSPSVREMMRGSAPLVRSRKANSKSWCCRHKASGLTWLSWRPSGKAGGGREGHRELHSHDEVQPGHLEAGPPLPLFPGKSRSHLTGEARCHCLAGKGFPDPQSESPAPPSALSVGLSSPSSLAPPAVPEQDMDASISPAGEGSRACKQLNPGAGLTPYLPHSQLVIRR